MSDASDYDPLQTKRGILVNRPHFAVGIFDLGPPPLMVATEPITAQEFLAGAEAIEILWGMIHNDSLSLLLLNTESLFEAQRMVGDRSGHPIVATEILNLRLFNWLAASRLYVDHEQARLTRYYGPDSAELAAFDEVRQHEFATSASYALIYKLRDYFTHSDALPGAIHEHIGQPPRLELSRDELLLWTGWRKRPRNVLKEQDPRFPVMPHVVAAMGSFMRMAKAAFVCDRGTYESALAVARTYFDRVGAVPDTGVPCLLIADEWEPGHPGRPDWYPDDVSMRTYAPIAVTPELMQAATRMLLSDNPVPLSAKERVECLRGMASYTWEMIYSIEGSPEDDRLLLEFSRRSLQWGHGD